MEKQEIIDFCLALGPTYADTPFANLEKGTPTVTMRHLKNKKIFAFIMVHENQLQVAVKGNPAEIEEQRLAFESVVPPYHMNKTHWNAVIIGGDVTDKQLQRMIEQSYELIKPKR